MGAKEIIKMVQEWYRILTQPPNPVYNEDCITNFDV